MVEERGELYMTSIVAKRVIPKKKDKKPESLVCPTCHITKYKESGKYDGLTCPVCSSDDISWGDPVLDDMEVLIDGECSDCHATWNERSKTTDFRYEDLCLNGDC